MLIARLFDGFGTDGTPYLGPDRPRIATGSERDRIARYLHTAPPVVFTTAQMDDLVDRGFGRAVPMSFHTDGTWIWCAALGYYARMYGISPEPEFLAHMQARDFTVPAVDDAVRIAALEQLQAHWAEQRRLLDAG